MNLSEIKKELKKLAVDENNVELAFVVSGETNPYDYLLELTKDNKETLGAKNRTVASTVKANANRYKQISKWIVKDDDLPYKTIYEKEKELLEEYVYFTLFDVLTK